MSYPVFLHEVLYEAAKAYLGTRERVFRAKSIGFEGSSARIKQEAEIAAEDKLLAAIAFYESTMPGQNKAGRI